MPVTTIKSESKMLPTKTCSMGSCSHTFHYVCIAKVVREAQRDDVTCPICRTLLQRVGDFSVEEINQPKALVLAYMYATSKLPDNLLALETSDKIQWFGDSLMWCISNSQVTDAEVRFADKLVKRYVEVRATSG
jgi:hypothetical protein